MKKIPYSRVLRWFVKGYSLVFLFIYSVNRFLFFQFSNVVISTNTSAVSWPASTNTFGWMSFVFSPIGLFLVTISLCLLAWKEKRWISDLIYPFVVLLLVIIGIFLY
jgi:hypothetical protein